MGTLCRDTRCWTTWDCRWNDSHAGCIWASSAVRYNKQSGISGGTVQIESCEETKSLSSSQPPVKRSKWCCCYSDTAVSFWYQFSTDFHDMIQRRVSYKIVSCLFDFDSISQASTLVFEVAFMRPLTLFLFFFCSFGAGDSVRGGRLQLRQKCSCCKRRCSLSSETHIWLRGRICCRLVPCQPKCPAYDEHEGWM